jgi:phytoene dehydrogenase-like protein
MSTGKRHGLGDTLNDDRILIVGVGHNGLVCTFYLASAGLKVKVVERRDVVGGAAGREEFHPGFRNSVAAYTASLLNPRRSPTRISPYTDRLWSSAAPRISCCSPMAAAC